jgi:septum site-determining protein MinC
MAVDSGISWHQVVEAPRLSGAAGLLDAVGPIESASPRSTHPPHISIESAKLSSTLPTQVRPAASAVRAHAVVECTRIDLTTNLELNIDTPANAPQPTVVEIRYGQMGLVLVRIRTTDPGTILDELTGRMATAPHFFRRTGVCLDLSALENTPDAADIRTVIDAIRRAGMLAIGLAGDSTEIDAVANTLNLPILSGFRAARSPMSVAQPTPAAPAAAPAPAPSAPAASPELADSSPTTLIQHQTVRSGQRIYARNRDLIVTAGIGAGAEVMADGCLHIYGSLRGRALAGARGQLTARVFCQEFYAELVSIAGVFRVFETIPAELAGKPVQAWLAGEDLHFARVGT